MKFRNGEKLLLSLAVPSLGLPALENASDAEFEARAAIIGYPDEGFLKRGEGNLEAWLGILGALPSTVDTNLQHIHFKRELGQ